MMLRMLYWLRIFNDWCNSDYKDHLRCRKCGSLKKTCWYVDCPGHEK